MADSVPRSVVEGVREFLETRVGPLLEAVKLQDGKTVTAASNDRSSVRWTHHYLHPIIQATSIPVQTAHEFELWIAPRVIVEKVARRFEWASSEIPLHAPAIGRRAEIGQLHAVRDVTHDVLYLIDPESARVLAVAADTPVNQRDLARQCRELLIAHRIRDGWIVMHAAGVSFNGVGTLFVGEQGSGKTTMSLAMLDAGASYLANDRVFVRLEDDGTIKLNAYGMSVRIGGATARNHPSLRSHLHAFDHFKAVMLPPEEQFAHADKLELTVAEYAALVGVPVSESASLGHLVFPTLKIGHSSPEVLEPTRTAARALLASSTLVPDPDGMGWLRALVHGPDIAPGMEATLEAMLDIPRQQVLGAPAELARILAHYHSGSNLNPQ